MKDIPVELNRRPWWIVDVRKGNTGSDVYVHVSINLFVYIKTLFVYNLCQCVVVSECVYIIERSIYFRILGLGNVQQIL